MSIICGGVIAWRIVEAEYGAVNLVGGASGNDPATHGATTALKLGLIRPSSHWFIELQVRACWRQPRTSHSVKWES